MLHLWSEHRTHGYAQPITPACSAEAPEAARGDDGLPGDQTQGDDFHAQRGAEAGSCEDWEHSVESARVEMTPVGTGRTRAAADGQPTPFIPSFLAEMVWRRQRARGGIDA